MSEVIERNGHRYDDQNRRLCHAKSQRSGELCRAPAMAGQRVCRVHGGSTPQAKQAAKLRLASLVNPAIGTLAREMTRADRSADRQRAANSILDRAGIGRVQHIDNVADSKELLFEMLRERRDQLLAGEGLGARPDDRAPDDDDLDDDLDEMETP